MSGRRHTVRRIRFVRNLYECGACAFLGELSEAIAHVVAFQYVVRE